METSKHQQWGKLTLLMVFLCTLSAATLSKDFYRWKDSEGVTHYSSVPPKEGDSTKVRATNTKAPVDGYSPANSKEPDSAASAEAAPPSAEQQEKARQLCEAAKKNAKTLQEKNRIRIKDDQGEYRYLDTNEIAQKLKTAQKIIEQECR